MAILERLRRMLRKESHKFGPLWVDLGHADVKRNGTLVSLTNLEFRLLRYLIERAGSLLSREELLRSVWDYSSRAFTRTVDMHIHRRRQKIENFLRGGVSIGAVFTTTEVLIFVPVVIRVRGYKWSPRQCSCIGYFRG